MDLSHRSNGATEPGVDEDEDSVSRPDRLDSSSLLPTNILPQPSDTERAEEERAVDSSRSSFEESKDGFVLRRNYYIVLLVVIYAGLAISSWTIICLLTFRPLTLSSYGWNEKALDDLDIDDVHISAKVVSLIQRNENWYQSALVIWTLVNLLTIPLTSTVCAFAVTRFTQFTEKGPRLTFAQTLALADRGWINIPLLFSIAFRYRNTGRHYASRFLGIALMLHLLGIAISLLQQILVSQETVLFTLRPYRTQTQYDLPLICEDYNDYGRIIVKLQNSLNLASADDIQQRLWARGTTCAPQTLFPQNSWKSWKMWTCLSDQVYHNFEVWNDLVDPFVAQLPSDFHTGLLRQYAPRINSSVTYERLDGGPLPACIESLASGNDNSSTHFTAQYAGRAPPVLPHDPVNWNISVCMPFQPWPINGTRDRQTLHEELYLTVSARVGYIGHSLEIALPHHTPETTFRISVNTSIGYFELPNVYNDGTPGPLLDTGPRVQSPSHNYQTQTYSTLDGPCGIQEWRTMQQDWNSQMDYLNLGERIMQTRNRGPLASVALALFGNTSFPAIMAGVSAASNAGRTPPCVSIAPLELVMYPYAGGLTNSPVDCSAYDQVYLIPATDIMSQWTTLLADERIMGPAMNVALFLANEQWLISDPNPSEGIWMTVGKSATSKKPSVSRTAMIALSTLLAVDLLALFGLAFFSSGSVVWTSTLDALALVRLGASLAERNRAEILTIGEEKGVLSQLPGYVGDSSLSKHLGSLALGGQRRLLHLRRYDKRFGDAISQSFDTADDTDHS